MLGEGPIEAPLHYGYGLLRCGLGGLPPRASTSRPPSYLLHLGRASAWRPAPHLLRRLAAHLLLGCPKSQCLAHCREEDVLANSSETIMSKTKLKQTKV